MLTDKLKILITEDDKLYQKIYDKALLEDVFEKHFVNNGKDAIELYKTWKPNIVILDIGLPDIAGYLVLKEIR